MSKTEKPDSVGTKLKRALGLEDLGDEALDRMCHDNMRLALFMCPILAVAVLVLLVVFYFSAPAFSFQISNVHLPVAGSLVMVLACVGLYVVAREYLRGKIADRHVTHVALGIFIVVGYFYAIMFSVVIFASFGRLSAFYIFLIIAGLLFVLKPVVQIAITLSATIMLSLVFQALGIGDAMATLNTACVSLVIVVAGTLRYAEQRRGVLANVESDEVSRTDALTGLRNRLAFNREYWELAGHPLIVAMVDIDDFKYFNDAYSHETGDEVLQKFSAVLKGSFPRAHIYRYGGDEFAVVADNTTDEDSFRSEAADFLKRAERIRICANDHETISASLGYSVGKPHDSLELGSMLHLADRKLYEAKRGGKSRFVGAHLDQADVARDNAMPGQLPLRRSYETDPLTGLPNMQYFRAQGLQFAAHLAATGAEPMLVYFNLANFKLVNERQGYRAGDELLCETADAIQGVFPDMLLALIAEDHFALVCPRNGLEDGVRQACELVDVHKGELSVALKAGACAIPPGTRDIGSPYDSAKIACDDIKFSFGRSLRFYDEELEDQVVRRRYVLDNIHDAIRRGDIVVRYQPVYRSMTGRLCGSEALVRWVDERYGTIPPGDFIGLLEDTQQIAELDAYVFGRVCDDWKALHDAGEPTLPVSVNFSRVDFQLMDIASVVEENVARVGMPRQMIHIEVTESAFTEADDALSQQIARLRELGYEVWMDDFGSGYSSLNQLKWHDFDLVKIDMVFLRNFEDDQVKALIASIVDMIKRLDVQTLIEGVETREQYEFMRDIGCEFVQGFYLSRPLEFSAFCELLRRSDRTGALEPFAMRGYYNAASKVNPLSPMPFSLNEGTGLRETTRGALPLAVLERRGNGVSYLIQTESFSGLLGQLEIDGYLEDRTVPPAFEQSTMKRRYLEFLDAAIGMDGPLVADFIIRGHECVGRAIKIASYGEATLVLFSLEERAHDSEYSLQDSSNLAFGYVNSLFEKVGILDLDTRMAQSAYDRTGEAAEEASAGQSMEEVVREHAETLVHPQDRNRYLELFDFGTLKERLQTVAYGYLGCMVRMLSKNGTYGWKVLLAIPAQAKSGNLVVLCRRDANLDLVDQLYGSEGILLDDLLWDAVLKLLPEKVFWKDAERRFLGANAAFLDYFGIESAREIVGKTDEDIGWNMDSESYRDDEIAVIEQGKTLERVPGICISKGQPRRIVASKMPLQRGGKVQGLIGYFSDIEQHERDAMIAREALSQDELTGVLNRYGFLSALAELEQAQEEGGSDYGVLYLDVDNLREINRQQGRAFGDRVLKKVAEVLIAALGPGQVIGRIRADEFAIAAVFPQDTVEEREAAVDELARTARDAVASVSSVDSTPCHLAASVGCSLRGESDNASIIVELAEQRMRDDRSARQVPRDGVGDAADMSTDSTGTGTSEDEELPLRMTRGDAARRVKVLQEHFDVVRIVNPSTCTAIELGGDIRTLHESCGHCYSIWGQCARCANCISARTLADGKSHVKYERMGKDLVRVASRVLEIDGVAYTLETVTRLPFKVHMTEEDRARFSDALSLADSSRYYDNGTQTYSAVYLEETLARLKGRQLAVLEATTSNHQRERERDFARDVARVVKAWVRNVDVIVHFRFGRFAIAFDSARPVEDLEAQLTGMRAAILEIPDAHVAIGAVEREGTVEDLVQEARIALFRASSGDGVLVVGGGSENFPPRR